MKKYLLLVSLLFSAVNISFGQQNQGTYIGLKDNTKIVAFLKSTNGLILGYLYENSKTYHTLTGLTIGNQVKGKIIFSGTNEFDYEGVFKGDSVYFYLNSIDKDHFKTFALKKISNQTKINLEKHFGDEKQVNDNRLVGEWTLLNDYNLETKKYNLEKDYTSIELKQNGTYRVIGYNASLPDVLMNWYTQDSTLFVNFKTTKSSREISMGKYVIKGDTLITTRSHVIKYLRKK